MSTKYVPPLPRSGLISRQQLVLTDERLPKLTLVAAPAGFGKTTLLVQCREHLLADDVVVPWLTPRADEQGAMAFLIDLRLSIQGCIPEFARPGAQLVNVTADEDISRLLKDFVADLSDAAQPIVLFVDDYQCISSAETDEVVELLLNLAPPNFHMVVASRTRPQFGLAALRVRDELRDVTASHLRFSLPEVARFLNEIRRVALSNEQIERLHKHSEGWVAGLQLASLALRDPHRCDGFIDSFSGRLQDIADYLAGDVLSQQAQEIQDFLMRTCVLERLCGDQAIYVSGMDNAQALLEQVERDGLFVMPLDEEHVWYRYHQLFQEFLLTELRRRHPGEVVGLYRRAGQWCEQQGLAGEAVDYALLAGDLDNVVSLVEQQSWTELKAGRIPRVTAWIQRIPESVRDRNPKLLYLLATALYHANNPDESEAVCGKLASLVAPAEGARRDIPRLQEQIRVLAAGIALARDDPDRILAALDHEFGHLSEFELGLVNNFRGYALADAARFAEANKALMEARQFHLNAGSEFGKVYTECFFALIDFANGNLDRCYARFFPGGDCVSKPGSKYIEPVQRVIQGIVLYQWNRVDEALAQLQPNLPLIREVGFTKLLVFGYTALARISGLRGDHRAAMRCYDLISLSGARGGTPFERHRALVEGSRIAYLLQCERLNEAIDYALASDIDIDADTLQLPENWERVACRNALTWVRLQIATGRMERTLPVLQRLRRLAQASRRGMRLIECYVLEARARYASDHRAARRLIDEALQVAAPNRSIRCFVDEGQEIDTLLLESKTTAIDAGSTTARNFLSAIAGLIYSNRVEAGVRIGRPQRDWPRLIEPLSDREHEILQLIGEGSTNSMIAESLLISENTVKWHLKNVFGKLGVTNRTSAVAVARQLELVP